jgi:hypothetical protein
MAILKTKHICPLCSNEYEKTDTTQATDKEKYIYFWENTLGREEAERSWEEKVKIEAQKRTHHMVTSDIGGYISQVDGTWIESRSKHRDHLKRHRMVEVGNDVPLSHKKIEVANTEQRKRHIAEQVYSKLRYN